MKNRCPVSGLPRHHFSARTRLTLLMPGPASLTGEAVCNFCCSRQHFISERQSSAERIWDTAKRWAFLDCEELATVPWSPAEKEGCLEVAEFCLFFPSGRDGFKSSLREVETSSSRGRRALTNCMGKCRMGPSSFLLLLALFSTLRPSPGGCTPNPSRFHFASGRCLEKGAKGSCPCSASLRKSVPWANLFFLIFFFMGTLLKNKQPKRQASSRADASPLPRQVVLCTLAPPSLPPAASSCHRRDASGIVALGERGQCCFLLQKGDSVGVN
nr:uncharacterized protein LOC112980548 [Dromaius novaehollandiae]